MSEKEFLFFPYCNKNSLYVYEIIKVIGGFEFVTLDKLRIVIPLGIF